MTNDLDRVGAVLNLHRVGHPHRPSGRCMNYDAALEQAQDAVEKAMQEYDRCLRDHAEKKSQLKVAEARTYMNSEGTVEARKSFVIQATANLLMETNIAEALEKSAKSALEVARDRVSVLQTRSKLNQPVAF